MIRINTATGNKSDVSKGGRHAQSITDHTHCYTLPIIYVWRSAATAVHTKRNSTLVGYARWTHYYRFGLALYSFMHRAPLRSFAFYTARYYSLRFKKGCCCDCVTVLGSSAYSWYNNAAFQPDRVITLTDERREREKRRRRGRCFIEFLQDNVVRNLWNITIVH